MFIPPEIKYAQDFDGNENSLLWNEGFTMEDPIVLLNGPEAFPEASFFQDIDPKPLPSFKKCAMCSLSFIDNWQQDARYCGLTFFCVYCKEHVNFELLGSHTCHPSRKRWNFLVLRKVSSVL